MALRSTLGLYTHNSPDAKRRGIFFEACCIIMLMEREEATSLIRRAGLGELQAKIYLTLVEQGELPPTKIAEIIGEKRTTVYASCEKLVELNILDKSETGKAKYKAKHPAALEILAEKRRKQMLKNEQVIKSRMNELADLFFKYSEEPGVKTAEGYEAIKDVYEDEIITGEDVYILRTESDIEIDLEWWNDYRERKAKAGIHTYALTADAPYLRKLKESGSDEKYLFHRTLIPKDKNYDGKVAIDVYGDKVALLVYGETQIATTIVNPLVAESFRWMLKTLMECCEEAGKN